MNQPGEPIVVHPYGIVAPDFSGAVPHGIGDAPVDVIQHASLGVLVSRLSAEEFGETAWREHGEDAPWLERVVAEHHRVLQAVIEQADVLPLKLPGIYADEAALEHSISDQSDALTRAFEGVRRHVEVGVKAYLVESTPEEPSDRPQTGRDYLLRRVAAGADREKARERRNAALAAAHERVAALASMAATRPPQDAALSGRAEPMVLNAAYLLERIRLPKFGELVADLARGLRNADVALEASGPWPPYTFVHGPMRDRVEVAP